MALARHVCVRAFQAQAEAPLYESQAAVQQTSARAFANFTIYKGKAALALKVSCRPSLASNNTACAWLLVRAEVLGVERREGWIICL